MNLNKTCLKIPEIFRTNCLILICSIFVITSFISNAQEVKEESYKEQISTTFLEQEKNSAGFCIIRGTTHKNKVALTFDDGPTDLSLKVIALLDSYDAKATFFWLGKNLQEKRGMISLANDSKHLIANHSWDHTNGWESTNEKLWTSQVKKTIDTLYSITGSKMRFYRPPFGGITQKQIDFLALQGIYTVLWSITTMDWDPSQNTEDEIFQTFKEQLHPGAIVLLHDCDFGNAKAKLKALERILIYGKSIGVDFVTIENINE